MFNARLTNQQIIKLWQIAFWLTLLALLVLTLSPELPRTTLSFAYSDKLFHFLAFAAFAFIFIQAFRKVKIYQVMIISAIVGVAIEIAQYFIPNRGFSYWDMLADFLGALSGCLAGRQTSR